AGDSGQVVVGVVRVAQYRAIGVRGAGKVAGRRVRVGDGLTRGLGDAGDPALAVAGGGDGLAVGGVDPGGGRLHRVAGAIGGRDESGGCVQHVDVAVAGGQAEPGRRVEPTEQAAVDVAGEVVRDAVVQRLKGRGGTGAGPGGERRGAEEVEHREAA